jgi:protein-disulfide isomerase/uncharacterized membrane protein
MNSRSNLKKIPIIVFILAVVGLFLASVALWEHVIYTHGRAQGPSFCNISAHFNCEVVNTSKWSSFFGLPVASYGIFFFLAALLSSMYVGEAAVFSLAGFAGLSFLGGLVATVGSIALFLISEFIIGSICLICVGMYLVNIAIFLVSCVYGREIPLGTRIQTTLREIGRLFSNSLVGEVPPPYSRLDFVIFLLCLGSAAGLSYISPGVALSFAPPKQPVVVPATPEEQVKSWLESPEVKIKVESEKGAFGDFIKGTVGAPIQIVEFADFECPACRRLYLMLKPLLSKYGGKYQLVFKNFPLDNACNPSINRQFHRYACFAARASRCAGEQGKYWEGIDFLFTYEPLDDPENADNLSQSMITDMAKNLELDEVALGECVKSERHNQVILNHIEEGGAINLQGTPTLIINGRKASYRPLEAVESVFKKILKDAGN